MTQRMAETVVAPLAIDLCCGMGGWTIGLQKAGFYVVGFDVEKYTYPGQLVLQDIRTLSGHQFRSARLIVASPPCQEFSRQHMKMFHPNAPHPALGIELFRACERIGREAGVPYVIENVIGARKFVGPSIINCGPFHLWGTGVPAILPHEAFQVRKGFKIGWDRKTGKRELGGGRYFASKSKRRKEWSAKIAMIPETISRYIGEVYVNG